MAKNPETMIHPFIGNECEVIHLQPGAVVEAGDVYRSTTLMENGQAIGPDSPGLGRWFQAGPILEGSQIHPECNVHFIRLIPIVGEVVKD